MRFKLVPTRRGLGDWYRPWFVDGTKEEAIASAEEFFKAEGVPVLVLETPDSTVIRPVCTVGKLEDKKKPKRAA